MGHLRNLSECLDDTFLDQQIPDGAKLVIVGQRSFTWDITHTGPNIALLNGNLTATKRKEHSFETVLGTISMSEGRHYWEIKIDKFIKIDDIIIGVSLKGMDMRARAFDTGKFWGWICTCNRKIFPSAPGGPHQTREYGGNSIAGDTIGCLFELRSNNMWTLTFFRNGVSILLK